MIYTERGSSSISPSTGLIGAFIDLDIPREIEFGSNENINRCYVVNESRVFLKLITFSLDLNTLVPGRPLKVEIKFCSKSVGNLVDFRRNV